MRLTLTFIVETEKYVPSERKYLEEIKITPIDSSDTLNIPEEDNF